MTLSQERENLTKEQLRWINEIESENDLLPAGYARMLVTWYGEHPEDFTPDKIAEWSATPVPKLTKTLGSAETYTGIQAEELFAKMKANCGEATVISVT